MKNENNIPIVAMIITLVLTFVFMILSTILSAQSGTLYYRSGVDFKDVHQGQFKFEVKDDILWVLEDYVYKEDNKKKRFTNYWGEKITAKAECGKFNIGDTIIVKYLKYEQNDSTFKQ